MISRAGSSRLTMRARVALLVPAALVLAAAGLSACSKETPPPTPPRPVLTIKITPITTERFGPFAGTVEARYETQLGFQTSGRIVARDVYVGDRVKNGQRLAALDPTIAQLGLTRAKADVADADAQFINAEGIARRQSHSRRRRAVPPRRRSITPLPAATPPKRGSIRRKPRFGSPSTRSATPN